MQNYNSNLETLKKQGLSLREVSLHLWISLKDAFAVAIVALK
jgi:hypothetical protein